MVKLMSPYPSRQKDGITSERAKYSPSSQYGYGIGRIPRAHRKG
jgi:hypothetical protein